MLYVSGFKINRKFDSMYSNGCFKKLVNLFTAYSEDF